MTRDKRFHSHFCQCLATDGSALPLSATKRLYLPTAQNVLRTTIFAGSLQVPVHHSHPGDVEPFREESLSAPGTNSPDRTPVWVCPSARHHGYSWSSAWKGFGYLPFLPRLISEPKRSRHPASSCSVSGFLGNLPCCDSSNITGTARTKPLKEEIPSPF